MSERKTRPARTKPFRTGIAYEVELRDGWFAKPYLAVDFIEHHENEEVYGIYIGRAF